MNQKLLVPDIGDFEKVEVIEILVKSGDNLKVNDSVITIESDKSSVEVPSTIEGTVESINVKIGDKVSKGDLILNLSSSKKIIPKDTENLITEAESVLHKENKIEKKELQNVVKEEPIKKEKKEIFRDSVKDGAINSLINP